MAKKKILDVITYHRCYNYGAALQAYATVEFLSKYDYTVEVIDYYPEDLKDFGTIRNSLCDLFNASRNIFLRIILSVIKTRGTKKLKKVFNRFIDNELPLTAPFYSCQQLKEELPKADFYCTGSDQVWNNYYRNFDDSFFLEFAPNGSKCFSLSSSFGKENFTEEEELYIRRMLKKYDYLSVREQSGVNILSKLGFHGDLILDPTLLVEPETWYKFAGKDLVHKPYLLVYQLHGDSDTMTLAKKFAAEKNIKIVRIITLPYQIKMGCKNIISPDVHDFVSLLKNAEYVFTDSFHGTVFSLIFHKKLGITLPKRFSNRISSLLSTLDVEHYIINHLSDWEKAINEECDKKIDSKLEILRSENAKKIEGYLYLG